MHKLPRRRERPDESVLGLILIASAVMLAAIAVASYTGQMEQVSSLEQPVASDQAK